MAKGWYIGDTNDKARKAKKMYIGDSNNIARKVKKVYVGDSNNIARLAWSSNMGKYVMVGESGYSYYINDSDLNKLNPMSALFGKAYNFNYLKTAKGKDCTYAISPQGYIDKTIDGVNWTYLGRTFTVITGAVCIAYGADMIVVSEGTSLYYSRDGITWTKCSITLNATINAISFGNGIFLALGYGSYCYTSNDGVNWTQRNFPNSNIFYDIGFGNGKFMITASGIAMTTKDGITWTNINAVTTGFNHFVCYFNGRNFITASHSGLIYLYDEVTNTWSQRSASGSSSITGIASNGSYDLLVGSPYVIYTLDNYNTFTKYTNPDSKSIKHIVFL